jgi:hypothetical protein
MVCSARKASNTNQVSGDDGLHRSATVGRAVAPNGVTAMGVELSTPDAYAALPSEPDAGGLDGSAEAKNCV